MRDQTRTGPGLTGPQRSLDEKVSRIQPQSVRLHLPDIDRLNSCAGRKALNPRRLAFENASKPEFVSVIDARGLSLRRFKLTEPSCLFYAYCQLMRIQVSLLTLQRHREKFF